MTTSRLIRALMGRWLPFLVLAAVTMATVRIHAAEPAWSNTPYSYVAVDQDLQALLRDFAASQGLSVVVSDKVQGTVSGRFADLHPREFLESIARSYGLVWYYDGGVLFIASAAETESAVIQLTDAPASLLRRTLEQLSIFDPRFGWNASEQLGVVFVSGPKRYVDLVQQTATLLGQREQPEPEIAVFPLKYASADDRTFAVRDKQIVVPGVATILKELVAPSRRGGVGTQVQQLPTTVAGVRGTGLISPELQARAQMKTIDQGGTIVPPEQQQPQPAPGQATVSPGVTASQDAVIQADPRLNAVVIRDRADRIPLYARLIQQLDVPVRLIQIEVAIIDISVSRLTELGVQWRIFKSGDEGVGVSSSNIDAIEAGLDIAATITGNPFNFLVEVRALERDGDAKVVSRPSVLTYDNVQAVIDETEQIYVRVPGNETSDLFPVSTGTQVQVTPHIVSEGGGNRIQMLVNVQDGSFSTDVDDEVDEIPRVTQSTLNTQALVNEGEGLIIGGLYRDSTTDAEDKVPVLGDIPVLGWLLFRSKKVEQSNVTRLFMITPQVVTLSPVAGPQAGEAARSSAPAAPRPSPAPRYAPGGPRHLFPTSTRPAPTPVPTRLPAPASLRAEPLRLFVPTPVYTGSAIASAAPEPTPVAMTTPETRRVAPAAPVTEPVKVAAPVVQAAPVTASRQVEAAPRTQTERRIRKLQQRRQVLVRRQQQLRAASRTWSSEPLRLAGMSTDEIRSSVAHLAQPEDTGSLDEIRREIAAIDLELRRANDRVAPPAELAGETGPGPEEVVMLAAPTPFETRAASTSHLTGVGPPSGPLY